MENTAVSTLFHNNKFELPSGVVGGAKNKERAAVFAKAVRGPGIERAAVCSITRTDFRVHNPRDLCCGTDTNIQRAELCLVWWWSCNVSAVWAEVSWYMRHTKTLS